MQSQTNDEESLDDVAARWVVRGLSPDLTEAELVEMAVWLEASEENVVAYAEAMRVWSQLSEAGVAQTTPKAPEENSLAQQLSAGLVRLDAHRAKKKQAQTRRWVMGGVAAGIAACFALFVVMPLTAPKAPFDVYETRKGQRQEYTLADGSHLRLNTDTKVSVRVTPKGREVVLDRGEIGLTVVHDETRPFVVTAGDTTATDLGTQFNVRRTDGLVRVAVTEGVVELGARQTQKTILRRGDMGLHHEGTNEMRLVRVNPEDVFAWTRSHAIYRDEPLSEVVKDLNRYFNKPLRVDARAADIRLTAILTLDSEAAVVRRLKDYLALDATATDQDILLYRSDRSVSEHDGARRQP